MEIITKGIIVGIVLWLINRSVHKKTVKGKLFFSSWMLWLGIIVISFPLIIFYAALFQQNSEETVEILPAMLLILIFFGFGTYAILEYLWTGGDYNDKHLTYRTPLKKQTKIYFSEIDYISYNEEMRWYLIYFNNQKIRLSLYLSGTDLLIEKLLEHDIPFKRDIIENRLFFPKGRLYLGVASILFASVIVYIFFFTKTKEGVDELISFLLIIFASGGGGVYAVLSYLRVRGHYTHNTLTYQPFFGKEHKIPFSAIGKVSHNNYLYWFVIDANVKKIRLSDSLQGLDFLLEKLDKYGIKMEN